jgi:hypothetical protein
MSKRRKTRRTATPARCDRCGFAVSHVLVGLGPEGEAWRLRSCDGCWPELVAAFEEIGASVGACSCPRCSGGAGRPASASTGAPAAWAGRAEPEARAGGRTAAADGRTGTLRAPV